MPYIFCKSDTVKINEIEYIHTIPDTAKIVEDFLIKREYEFTVFDNEISIRICRLKRLRHPYRM